MTGGAALFLLPVVAATAASTGLQPVPQRMLPDAKPLRFTFKEFVVPSQTAANENESVGRAQIIEKIAMTVRF